MWHLAVEGTAVVFVERRMQLETQRQVRVGQIVAPKRDEVRTTRFDGFIGRDLRMAAMPTHMPRAQTAATEGRPRCLKAFIAGT